MSFSYELRDWSGMRNNMPFLESGQIQGSKMRVVMWLQCVVTILKNCANFEKHSGVWRLFTQELIKSEPCFSYVFDRSESAEKVVKVLALNIS